MKIFSCDEMKRIQNQTPGQRHRLVVLAEQDRARLLAGHFSILPPGGDVPYHYHERRESIIYLLEGDLVEIVDGKEHPLRAGDTLFIAAGERHRMENRSDREARYMEFFTPIARDFIEIAP